MRSCCAGLGDGGRIPTIVAVPRVPSGRDPTPYTHYALLRSIEATFGLPFLGHAGEAGTATIPALVGTPGRARLCFPEARHSRVLAELGENLVLVYTPTYDPDANRIEWLWRSLRRTVAHTHQRQRLADPVADADRWARTIPAAQVLSQIGSPFAPDQQPVPREELNRAA